MAEVMKQVAQVKYWVSAILMTLDNIMGCISIDV
jgi:hypothetical protein